MPITTSQRRALEWFRDNSPAHEFPPEAPSATMRRKLVSLDYVRPGRLVGTINSYQITAQGLAALEEAP